MILLIFFAFNLSRCFKKHFLECSMLFYSEKIAFPIKMSHHTPEHMSTSLVAVFIVFRIMIISKIYCYNYPHN